MADEIDKINLFAGAHAIETSNFVVNFGSPIDHADVRRFDERLKEIEDLFPAVTSPEVFQFAIGAPPPGQFAPPPPVPIKDLKYFGNDGRPIWVGSFGENRLLVSCRKYSGWETVWPEAKLRLDALLACVDGYKPVHSVDYSVTDTFSADREDNALLPPIVFRETALLPNAISKLNDPRWDFNLGWFDSSADNGEVLVRVEGRSGLQNKMVAASISNLHSQRLNAAVSVSDLIAREPNKNSIMDQIFDQFHDMNKAILRSILVDPLLDRMKLKEN